VEASGQSQKPARKEETGFTALLLWMGVPVSFVALVILGPRLGLGKGFAFWLALALTPVLIVCLLYQVERKSGARGPRSLRFLLVTAVLAGEVGAMVLVSAPGNDNRRCVSEPDMTVVPASDCQGQGSAGSPANGPSVWYYGGTGTQLGDTVQGGSVNSPAEPDGGSGGGDNGDDGGDDGGGGDGGGGDG
jgi:hypothetical protein